MDDRKTSPLGRGLLKAALLLGLVAIGTGIGLGQKYSTDPSQLVALRGQWRGTEFAALLAKGHFWSNFLLILVLTVALAALFWSGDFKASKFRWLGAVGMLLTGLGLQITGNALPMDRHDARTVAVEVSIAARTPGIGHQLAQAARGGEHVGPTTVGHWYRLHRTPLTIGFAAAMVLAIAGVFGAAGSKGDRKSEAWAVGLPLVALLALSLAVNGPTGELATPADFESQAASPSWYVLPLHALLKVGDSISAGMGWIGAIVIPGILTIGLVLAPWWLAKVSDAGRRAVMLGVLLMMGVLIGLYGSAPAPLIGDQPVFDEPAYQTSDRVSLDEALASRGRPIFQTHCSGCHGLKGVGTDTAPSLRKHGGGLGDRAWIIKFVSNPSAVRQGSTMPPIVLTREDYEAVAEAVRSF
jgi:ubiquinol-cytochrome c reductase cytochrome b subunit